MKIQDIQEQLIGRKVRYYDSFTGCLVGFEVGKFTEVCNSLCLEPREGTSRIYINKYRVEDLLKSGYIFKEFEVDGCRCKEEWSIE